MGANFPFRLDLFSSLEHELKVSYCDRMRYKQFALKAYSSYTPGPIDSKLIKEASG